MSTLTAGRDAQALHRAAAPDYFGWLEHTRAAGGCTRPIRLAGTLTAVEPGTGRVLAERHTDELPDRTLYKACGNRRARPVPRLRLGLRRRRLPGRPLRPGRRQGRPRHRQRASGRLRHLHRAVLRRRCTTGTSPDTPAPAGGAATAVPHPATPGAPPAPAQHGQPAACFARHDADDPQLGRPLCLDCYDHDHQAVWNYFSGELWRRTKQAIERHLTAVCRRRGIPHVQVVTDSGKVRRVPPVRVSHGKVAEMQRRGAVHFHVLLRLDGVDPARPARPGPAAGRHHRRRPRRRRPRRHPTDHRHHPAAPRPARRAGRSPGVSRSTYAASAPATAT